MELLYREVENWNATLEFANDEKSLASRLHILEKKFDYCGRGKHRTTPSFGIYYECAENGTVTGNGDRIIIRPATKEDVVEMFKWIDRERDSESSWLTMLSERGYVIPSSIVEFCASALEKTE